MVAAVEARQSEQSCLLDQGKYRDWPASGARRGRRAQVRLPLL